MRRALDRLALVLICGASAAPVGAVQASPQSGAPAAETEAWLRQDDGESLLRYFLADGVFSELQSAQLALGIERTCELVTPMFEKAVREVRRPWTRMYRRMAAKFPYQPGNRGREVQLFFAVGMEAVDLLQPRVAAITEPVQVESLKVDSDAINYETAFTRLSDARADGRAWCGLRRPVLKAPGPPQQNDGD